MLPPDVTTIVTIVTINVSRGSNGVEAPAEHTDPRRAPSLPTLCLGTATATFKRTAGPRCDVTSQPPGGNGGEGGE